MTDSIPRGQAVRVSLQKIILWKSQCTDFNEDVTNECASVACSNVQRERKNEETCLGAFEMKGLRKILRVSWTERKQMSGFFTKLERRGTVRYCESKEASILWSHHEETRELPGERDNARNNARCMQARKTPHGVDGQRQNVDTTPVEESLRMTEDRDKWRKCVHGVANPRIEDG